MGIAVAIAMATIACVFVPVASAAEKGVVPDFTWGTTSHTQDKTATALADSGAKWVRLNISWSWVNPQQGQYDTSVLADYDRAVQLSRQSGARIVMMVDQAPAWASGSSVKETPPRDPADMATFMQWLASRYGSQVDAYEIWNEQNSTRFWSTGPNPGQYAQLLKAAYGGVKAGNPAAKVLFGGLAFNDRYFVQGAYDAMPNLGLYFDAMAVHPYPTSTQPNDPSQYTRDGDGRISWQSFAGYREVRNTMLAHGDDKPIWFTEFGWSTTTQNSYFTGVSEATQADYLTKAFRCIEQDPYVQVATWYNFRNNFYANDADTWEDQLGLLRDDFSPKPAYDAFKAYQPGQGGCNYTQVGGPPEGALPLGSTPPATSARIPTPVSLLSSARTGASATTATGATSARRARIELRIRRLARATAAGTDTRPVNSGQRFQVLGRVVGMRGGIVRLVFERRSGGRWVKALAATARVSRSTSAFTSKRIGPLVKGRWRLRATYVPSGSKPAASRLVYFRS